MINGQFEKVREKIRLQVKLIFKGNEKPSKREYLDEIYSEFGGGLSREQAMILITADHARLREVWKSCGSEAVWDIITDGKPR